MSERPDQPLIPSVLDRLLDDEPGRDWEPARDRAQRLADLKASVRRDVEDLLNTRRRLAEVPPGLREAADSLLTYGLPDVSGAGPATGADRAAFARRLEHILGVNDARLTRVAVEVVPTDDAGRALKFRITALLRADPAPEPVAFDSALDPASGEFRVGGGS